MNLYTGYCYHLSMGMESQLLCLGLQHAEGADQVHHTVLQLGVFLLERFHLGQCLVAFRLELFRLQARRRGLERRQQGMLLALRPRRRPARARGQLQLLDPRRERLCGVCGVCGGCGVEVRGVLGDG